jgi:magnesium-transporting ATPase (P-type)
MPYRLHVDEVVAALGSDAQHGLTDEAARARLEQYGRNELVAQKPSPAWRRFLAQFQDVLVILLLIATAISAGLWVYERDSPAPYEAIAIFAVVLLNATMGYVQESRAETAVAALRAMSAADATVVRAGQRRSVPASEIVPGDLIVIEEGDTIPADARLVQSTALQAAEAALTGESLPVSKDTVPIDEEVALGDRHNLVFSGTAATFGHGMAVVTATGMATEMGRVAGLLKETSEEATPLQKELDKTGKLLGLVVVAARKAGLQPEELDKRLPRIGEVPFSSATQILWINLVTDGPPALALGVDPADEGLMEQPPRPPGEGVITPRMWWGIAFVGVIMAVGTLFVLDASMPGGYVDGTGDLRYGQTMAFTTLMLFQIFNVVNARSDVRSAFYRLFTNGWLWAAIAFSIVLQLAVVYEPLLQRAFGTVGLSGGDWLRCLAVASFVLWLTEIKKLIGRSSAEGHVQDHHHGEPDDRA